MTTYFGYIDKQAERHSDVLKALWAAGFDGNVDGTGGGCTGIILPLAKRPGDEAEGYDSAYLHITDLAWGATLTSEGEERSGWLVGYYGPENGWSAEADPSLEESSEPTPASAVALCQTLAERFGHKVEAGS